MGAFRFDVRHLALPLLLFFPACNGDGGLRDADGTWTGTETCRGLLAPVHQDGGDIDLGASPVPEETKKVAASVTRKPTKEPLPNAATNIFVSDVDIGPIGDVLYCHHQAIEMRALPSPNGSSNLQIREATCTSSSDAGAAEIDVMEGGGGIYPYEGRATLYFTVFLGAAQPTLLPSRTTTFGACDFFLQSL